MEHQIPQHSLEFSKNEVKTLISWTAPGRPFQKKGRQFYASITLLVFFLSVLLFLFGEYLLIAVVMTLALLSVALSTIAPRDFHYRISTQGIKVEDHFYIWSELYDFYFKKIEGMDVLIVRTESIYPGELKITLGNVSVDHVRSVVAHFLPYREVVKANFMERSADWLSDNFPLEKSK